VSGSVNRFVRVISVTDSPESPSGSFVSTPSSAFPSLAVPTLNDRSPATDENAPVP
jgi:hypothetical protein